MAKQEIVRAHTLCLKIHYT